MHKCYIPWLTFLLCVVGCSAPHHKKASISDQISDTQIVLQVLGREECNNAKTIIKKTDGRITFLEIKDADLFSIPKELMALDSLKVLWLSRNKIKDISAIARFKNLQSLHLSKNDIDHIPVISHLNNLETVVLDDNNLTESLDCNIFPSSLELLSLDDNNMSKIENVDRLLNLEQLSFSRNNLKMIPSGICRLTQLWDLKLYANPLMKEDIDLSCMESLNFLTIDSIYIFYLKVPSTTKVTF